MAWDKEKEANAILEKELKVHKLFKKQRIGPPEAYLHTGYVKESAMQGDFYAWAVNSYIDKIPGYLFHVANEGNTGGEDGARQGAMRAAMGVLSGVPDMFYVRELEVGNSKYNKIICCELKLPGEGLSKSQKILHNKWNSRGINIPIIKTFTDWRWWIEHDCLGLI